MQLCQFLMNRQRRVSFLKKQDQNYYFLAAAAIYQEPKTAAPLAPTSSKLGISDETLSYQSCRQGLYLVKSKAFVANKALKIEIN
jgi:hypothetical protein